MHPSLNMQSINLTDAQSSSYTWLDWLQISMMTVIKYKDKCNYYHIPSSLFLLGSEEEVSYQSYNQQNFDVVAA